MSDTTASLQRKLNSATDLQSVVRTMKAMAAANISQFEKSVTALADYYQTVELGLHVCLRATAEPVVTPASTKKPTLLGAVVFGSDQGLVGQFNDTVTNFALKTLKTLPSQTQIWVVGERVEAQLAAAGFTHTSGYNVPNSVKGITSLIAELLLAIETRHSNGDIDELHIFFNSPTTGSVYTPAHQRLLPLDEHWRQQLITRTWPSKNLPEVIGNQAATLQALIREYLFISLFRACAESLASENASRLAAMQRAEKNIDELLDELHGTFHRLRQSGIDEELFDVISGFEALGKTD